ncbi:Uncharacterized protein LCER1_G005760 [Lachnellula cervina]|uniref:Nudix hydrolase domain-containing protein n=1 Tax=Lachnellula cervina TaxID=1316786 RepID=A0A7D8YLF0_9HELO|nr:Uncharacterized protein LCER1_G005760 [Lachnellula cervina]
MVRTKSNLELAEECDSFPYPGTEAHAAFLSTTYTLLHDSIPIGYILESVFNALAKVPIRIKGELEVSRKDRTITWPIFPTEQERSSAVAATCQYWRENKTFEVLAGWRNELYPVYAEKNELIWNVERSASCLFGVVTYGVHMSCYTLLSEEEKAEDDTKHGFKLWIPRRAKSKQTYGGMLDNTVAGGIASGEEPFDSLVREADEEASLPAEHVRGHAKDVGTVTYIHIREARAGGESGVVQPECEYVYDLELPQGMVPKPQDGEVECFYLWTVEECLETLGKGEFKPNCAVVVLDFLVRWGVIVGEEGKEIGRRVHRKLGFPGPHGT